MRVALVYNQKKEDTVQQSGSTEAPRDDRSIPSPLHLSLVRHPSAPLINDLYAEWDTPETIGAVHAALAEVHNVIPVEANESAYERLRNLRPDIVFNIAEGLVGSSRESQVPAMLEMLGIPYTGSDPLTLGICLDKSRAKEILAHHAIPTPDFRVIHTLSELENVAMPFPAIVKPLHEGSSKGITNTSVVRSRDELMREGEKVLGIYHEPVLIEEYLPGREFTVAMLGNGEEVAVLPIVEIKFDTLPQGVNPIYSYEAKWIWDRAEAPLDIFECPARIPEALRSEIETICRSAYRVLRCRDWCRIDVRLDPLGRAHVLELNPLPGILPNPEDNSCFPKAARAAGLGYNQLIQTVLALGAKRYGLAMNGSTVVSTSYQERA